ncbi:MAG: hypothetical protein M3R36_13090 [Bacteroidota bacterium]|nr:hypothetical protein [Bacteroidota bacterium]
MKLTTKSFLFLISIFSTVILIGCAGGGLSPEYSTYEKTVRNQMQEMSNVLFAGHNSEFMSKYVDPSYISSMGGLDKALLQFSNSEQQLLYRVLKIAQNVTPFYDENTKTLTYTASIAKPLAFTLKNGKWYMQGDWFRN